VNGRKIKDTALKRGLGPGADKKFVCFWELAVNRNPFPALVLPGEPEFAPFLKFSGKFFLRFCWIWGHTAGNCGTRWRRNVDGVWRF
jgi:hypothetical protein